MFWALGGLIFLWWMYRGTDDPVGEMVVDQDDIDWDDDLGEDVDGDE